MEMIIQSGGNFRMSEDMSHMNPKREKKNDYYDKKNNLDIQLDVAMQEGGHGHTMDVVGESVAGGVKKNNLDIQLDIAVALLQPEGWPHAL
ncbi:hypothetical protein ACP4OV_010837 [Aristida adscensionis]